MFFRIIFSLVIVLTVSIAMGGFALASVTSGSGHHMLNLAVNWLSYASLAFVGAACAFVIVEEIAHMRDSKK